MLPSCHLKPMQLAGLGLGLAMLSSAPASAGFDEDGNLDAVFANGEGQVEGQANEACLGNGTGAFDCADVAEAILSRGVAVGDVDNDGHLDAVFGGFPASRDIPDSHEVCLGNGTGEFRCHAISVGIFSNSVALGNINGDSYLDAIYANVTGAEDTDSRACLGDGTGDFECGGRLETDGAVQDVALGDVDGDGNLDAIFANVFGRVCLGDGTGSFECDDVSDDPILGDGVALGFVNDDDHLDAIFAGGVPLVGGGELTNLVCLGRGDGTFGGFGEDGDHCGSIVSDRVFSRDVALGDLNGDGKLDAVFANINRERDLIRCRGELRLSAAPSG